jgi:type IV pilus assembly protein PilC
LVFFTRQLATMIQAGVPLSQALVQLAEEEKPVFKKIILQMEADISMGNTFSDAMARHPGAFSSMYVAVVRSGEVAGALDKVLEQMATYQENQEALRQKVAGAMRYPKFIGGFVMIMVTAILLKLVPVFESMYAGFNANLPGPTKILISVSNLIQHNLLPVIGGLLLSYVLFKLALNRPSFKFTVHKGMLYVPVYGLIIRKNLWANFSRTMALLLESGTPILQAIEITAAVLGNLVFSAKLKFVYEKLRTGESLSQALKETGVFPSLVTQLTSTGEKSGRIDTLLRKAADFYEREIRVTVESISSIIEPILIIVIGTLVGAILIALYLPIFNLGKLIEK